MTKPVVHYLEVVKVQVQNGEWFAQAGEPGKCTLQRFKKR